MEPVPGLLSFGFPVPIYSRDAPMLCTPPKQGLRRRRQIECKRLATARRTSKNNTVPGAQTGVDILRITDMWREHCRDANPVQPRRIDRAENQHASAAGLDGSAKDTTSRARAPNGTANAQARITAESRSTQTDPEFAIDTIRAIATGVTEQKPPSFTKKTIMERWNEDTLLEPAANPLSCLS